MERTLYRDLASQIGQKVMISGWLHKKRLLGGLNFVSVRDRTGVSQCLIDNKVEMEKLRGMQIGTVVTFIGTVVADKRAPGGAELHDVSVTVDVPVTEEPPVEIDKPISHKPENLEALFEHRVLNIRNPKEQEIFKIRAGLVQEIRKFLISNEFMEIDTPKLIAEATEGGAEVFRLDYFDKVAYLAQSPQFYKQIMVGAFERVFEINHSYRAEPSATTRHLTELTMLDIEMGFVKDHQTVLTMIGNMVQTVLKNIYQQYERELKDWQAPELILPVDGVIPSFTIAQIHEMYTKDTGTDTTEEKDLIPDEERWICEYSQKNCHSDLVFAANFPKVAGKFYHKFNDDGTVAWSDLLFRGLEIATCPLRENHYDKMIEQMTNAGLDVNEPGFKYYLQAFKYGLPTHGGCGMGVDRLVQKTIGLANVKEAALFPRDINRLVP